VKTESIHITRWGKSGPRVVLIHGGGQGTPVAGERNFAAQQVLSADWQLVVPDRPGHGRSPDPGRPDDAKADGAWVAELLEDGAHLIGHSFGGAVALAAAAMRPEAVRSLTLIEPAMLKFATDDPRVRKFVLKLVMTMLFSLSATRRAVRCMTLLGIPSQLIDEATPDELKRMGKSLRDIKLPTKNEIQEELDVIRQAGIPLLVVTGGWSPAFEGASDRVAASGGGRRAIVKSGHHFPQWIAGEFNQVIGDFMRESDKRRG